MLKKIIALFAICILAVGLSGCADMSDQDRTKTEGAGVGAGAGALIGALIGAAAGDTEGALIGAAIGAAAGGAAGYSYGSHVAGEKTKYAKEEEWLDACIASAQKTNVQMVKHNQELRTEIARLQAETDQLLASYKQSDAKRKQLAANKKKVDNQVAGANASLNSAREELKAQQGVLADARQSGKGAYADRLDAEIKTLQNNIADLEKQTDTLAAMSSRMSV